ncbi:hypothetical protein J4475_04345 [Candidatus Woesearchaeota archaeon]|nr:hypothetical protein [Candidatus Woesearchaeota archaeon]
MKHPAPFTIYLIILFFSAQVIGLFIISQYVHTEVSTETGQKIVVGVKELPAGIERPPVTESASFIPIIIGVLVGTVLVLLLAKYRKPNWWRTWFFASVTLTMTIAFAAFLKAELAFMLAAGLAYFKIVKPNVFIHNITELFIYSGIAAIFVPVMNVFSATVLLLLISGYDVFAVWKSKHMIKLADFQANSKVFAGLAIPYKKQLSSKRAKAPASKLAAAAILGGGDIAFPMLFAGTLLKSFSFPQVLLVVATATMALAVLLFIAKKGRFYPAMPVLTIGCLIGYWVLLL